MLEQPRGSLLQWHPRLQWLMGMLRVWRFEFSMLDFGSATLKPTWLYASDERCGDVRRHYVPRDPRPREMVRRYINKQGREVYAGARDLKASQAYPAGFGDAVASMFVTHQAAFCMRARALHKTAVRAYEQMPPMVVDPDPDVWADAQLAGVLELLSREHA